MRPARLFIAPSRLSYFQAQLRAGERAELTIRTYLAHLASALKWAVDVGLLVAVPKIQRPKRVKGSKLMKGRPISTEEFERLLTKVEMVVGEKPAEAWRHYLNGLWYSGLRLGESLELTWDDAARIRIDLSGRHPMLWIPGELEKGNQDRLLPIAPDFAEFLLRTPKRARKGVVFHLPHLRWQEEQAPSAEWVSRIISRIGKKAGVKVNTCPRTGKVKYASAHDLRRSFGERWSRRVMPQVLKELMRHESIETTMKYYVGHNAQMTADALWLAYSQQPRRKSGNTSGNSRAKRGGRPKTPKR